MGHKTHPLGFRLGITEEYKSSWYTPLKNYSNLVEEDYRIRNFLFKFFTKITEFPGISKIVINRNSIGDHIDIIIHTTKPGILVGKEGSVLKEMREQLEKQILNKTFRINMVEIQNPYQHAEILADILVESLEMRVPFRRAMKNVIETANKENIKGIKVQIAGRLNGAEIARTEWLRDGRVPLQTLRANIDYSYKTAKTTYGILGIKIWLFTGEIVST